MIRATLLGGKPIQARDGRIGSLDDLYFQDEDWKIRYLVVDTGRWLPGREVLIPPEAVLLDWHGQSGIPVDLTKDEVKACPEIATVEPQSPGPFSPDNTWIAYGAMPGDLPVPAWSAPPEETPETVPPAAADPHLRSTAHLIGYQLRADDGPVGPVEDLLLDDEQNRIRFLVVATAGGRKVLIPSEWIGEIDQSASAIMANASRHDVEARPEYQPEP